MKKRRWYLLTLALVAALSLTACKRGDDKETTVSFDDKGNETVEETKENIPETTEEVIPETTEAETEAETSPREEAKKEPPVLMASGDKKLTEDELKKYAQYFSEYGTWYTQALTSFYDSAKMVDLKDLFYNGIDGDGQDELTDAEKKYLKENAGKLYYEELDTSRIPVAEMDKILQKYFGIRYEKTAKVGTESMAYWKDTESFYISRGDTNATRMVPYAAVQRPNGNIVLFYEHEWSENGYCMITIRPAADGIQIVANQKVTSSK